MTPFPTIDDYTLASFMAGTLSTRRRQEVASYLAHHAYARELLQMASEALEASGAREERPSSDEASTLQNDDPASLHERLGHHLSVILVIATLGLSLHFAFFRPEDTLRTSLQPGHELMVRVDNAGLPLRWSATAEADRYRIVIWDPATALVVAEHETANNRLATTDPFLSRLHSQLRPGHTYALRIDALDVRNRLIRRSEMIDLVPQP